MTSREPLAQSAGDFLARPSSALIWWGLPLATGLAANVLATSPNVATLVWATAFAWMGTGCALNARRRRRLHCYLSAPVLLLGAVAAVVVALGFRPLGPSTSGYVVSITFGLALLTSLVEPIWGRYRPQRSARGRFG